MARTGALRRHFTLIQDDGPLSGGAIHWITDVAWSELSVSPTFDEEFVGHMTPNAISIGETGKAVKEDKREKAWSLLKPLKGFVRWLNGYDADDVLSEAFLLFLEYIERGGEVDAKTARNMLRDAESKLRKALAAQKRKPSGKILSIHDHPVAQREPIQYPELIDALSKLEIHQAQIIQMKYFGGLSYKEIAARQSMSEHQVAKEHSQGIEKLKRALGVGTDSGSSELGEEGAEANDD